MQSPSCGTPEGPGVESPARRSICSLLTVTIGTSTPVTMSVANMALKYELKACWPRAKLLSTVAERNNRPRPLLHRRYRKRTSNWRGSRTNHCARCRAQPRRRPTARDNDSMSPEGKAYYVQR